MSGLTMIVIGLVLGLAGGWSIRTVLMLVGFGAGWLLADVFNASFLVSLVIALVAAALAWLVLRLATTIVFFVVGGLVGAAVGARLYRLLEGGDGNLLLAVGLHPGDRHRRRLAGREDPGAVRRLGHLDRRCGPGAGWSRHRWSPGWPGCATRTRPGRRWSARSPGSPCRSPSGSARRPSAATHHLSSTAARATTGARSEAGWSRLRHGACGRLVSKVY